MTTVIIICSLFHFNLANSIRYTLQKTFIIITYKTSIVEKNSVLYKNGMDFLYRERANVFIMVLLAASKRTSDINGVCDHSYGLLAVVITSPPRTDPS